METLKITKWKPWNWNINIYNKKFRSLDATKEWTHELEVNGQMKHQREKDFEKNDERLHDLY